MDKPIKVLAFSGSTRSGSFNTMALKAAAKLAPEEMQIEIFDLKDLPFMNQDLEKDNIWPEPVKIFRDKIREADAILVSTPEYGNMVPGYLKNAFEWASRNSIDPSPTPGKPLAIMGASDGFWGTVRAQLQLLEMGLILKMLPHADLRLAIPEAQDKFDASGELIDEEVKERMVKFFNHFKEYILKNN
jgi:chromate reductase, NAD(P)H dehydrogenase (quinone)